MSEVPDSLTRHIQDKLHETVRSAKSVTGGDINQAAKLEFSSGNICFLKWNTTASPDMFVREVNGLKLLREANTALIIPDVLSQGTTPGGTGFLLMQYLEEGQGQSHSAADFGSELAQLHKTRADQFGLDYDNYIGSLPQSNKRHSDWISFFVEERMEPQLGMAIDSGKLSMSIPPAFQQMYTQLPGIFPEEAPSLLHGDLWGGNYFYNTEGQAVIYDPAVYYGHREMELAFTRLFGGFAPAFYRAYEQAYPLEPGFEKRKDIYNLYPLLVHTNLFGGSYARQVEGITRRFG